MLCNVLSPEAAFPGLAIVRNAGQLEHQPDLGAAAQ